MNVMLGVKAAEILVPLLIDAIKEVKAKDGEGADHLVELEKILEIVSRGVSYKGITWVSNVTVKPVRQRR